MALWDNIQGKWKLGAFGYGDSSGNANLLTANGSFSNAIGHGLSDNTASLFTRASENRLSIADGSQVGLDITGNLTISAWFYLTTLTSGEYYMIVNKLGDTSTTFAYDLWADGTNKKLVFRLSSDGSSTSAQCTGGTTLTTATWYHVVAVYDGTDMRIYLNGSLDSNGANNPKTYSGGIYNSTNDFAIGAARTGATWQHHMNGRIDDVAIWSRALTPTEIRNLNNIGDDFFYTQFTGIIVDKNTNIIDCSIYPVHIVANVVENTATPPVSVIDCINSDGSWTMLSKATLGVKYLITFEFIGTYTPTGEINISGAEYMTPSAS